MSSLVTHNVETFDVYFCNFTIQNFLFNFLTNTINLLKTLLTIFMPFLCLLSWNWILDNKNTRCLPYFLFARVFTPKLSWYLYWINRITRPFSRFHMYGKLKRFVIPLYNVLEFIRIVSRKTKQKTKKNKNKNKQQQQRQQKLASITHALLFDLVDNIVEQRSITLLFMFSS